MTTYHGVYEFTGFGLNAFKRIFEGTLDEAAIDPTDAQFAKLVPGTRSISDTECATSKELAQRVLAALGSNWTELLPRGGIWAWLTFVLRDLVIPKSADGGRRPGEM